MTRRKNSKKPSKPYPDFPLSSHPSGQWCKRIRGTLHYFGSWDDPQAALSRYLEQRDYLQAGTIPPVQSRTVANLLNEFLSNRAEAVDLGELTDDSYAEIVRVTDTIAKHLGASRPLEGLDLTGLRSALAMGKDGRKLGVATHKRRLAIARSVFLFSQVGINYRSELKAPPARSLRKVRREAGERIYSCDEIRALVLGSDAEFSSMILLGLSCAFSTVDVANLPANVVKGDFIEYHREKTEITRRAWRWPEVKILPPWSRTWTRHSINHHFKALTTRISVQNHGFGGLRRTFETVASVAEVNQAVIDCVMGHQRQDMASIYRRRIFDDSLRKVGAFVRDWYLGLASID